MLCRIPVNSRAIGDYGIKALYPRGLGVSGTGHKAFPCMKVGPVIDKNRYSLEICTRETTHAGLLSQHFR
jgi:hypothetical protein